MACLAACLMSSKIPTVVSAVPSESKRDEEQPWFGLMQALGDGTCPPEQGIAEASSRLQMSGDGCWGLPLAMAYWSQKKYQECCDVLEREDIAHACAHSFLYFNLLGMSVRHLPSGESRARAAYEKALIIDPQRADTLYNLANLLKDDDQHRANQLYSESLRINAWGAECWHNYGSNLSNLHAQENAVEALQTSIFLDPNVADVWCNLGLAYYGLDRFDEAERCFRFSLSMDTSHAQSHINLGNTLINSFRPDEAVVLLERGLELDPSSHNSIWNLALAYLLLGRFDKGWKYYETRFNACKEFENLSPPTSGLQVKSFEQLPRHGDPELIVWSEQGLGDSIQFVRYLHLLQAAGIPFLFVARDSLFSLLSKWTGLSKYIIRSSDLPEGPDQRCHLPLMSLPMVFNTELHTIPASVPYLAPSEPIPDRLKIVHPPGGLSVGIVWASNPDNKAMYRNKSIPLEHLIPLFVPAIQLNLIELHCLQFGEDSEQLNPWRHIDGIIDWKEDLRDFSETAHIVHQLDLVICIDTAVAHLAGALNRPTWLLLPYNADFRWLRDRNDSPWYPSMRLFRQTARNDWPSVVEQINLALNELFQLDLSSLTRKRIEMTNRQAYLNDHELLALVRRMDLMSFVKRHLEEDITRLVNLPPEFLEALTDLWRS